MMVDYDMFGNGSFIIRAPDDCPLLDVLANLEDLVNGIEEIGPRRGAGLLGGSWGEYVRE